MIITTEQIELLKKYLPESEQLIRKGLIGELLTELDDALIDIGMNKDYELNEIGLLLQKLYDQLFMQNEGRE